MTLSPNTAIALQGVGKRYWKLEEQAILLRSIIPMWRPSRSELWALHDVNLQIDRGQTVGILGRNGAGKTTLLRLLAGVTQPTKGQVMIRGRVAPLISVGVGFHQEMSGRENVYVNGMLLGLTRREVDARFDEIVAFSELESFIDTPVKFYSTGMFMRLGFSVAVACDPDVLLVDEVLAVGDVAFQLKCLERMREIQTEGTTIILVSHSMQAIRLLCPRTMVVSRGAVVFDGDTQEAVNVHLDLLARDRYENGEAIAAPVEVIESQVCDQNGPTFHLPAHEAVTYRATIRFHTDVDRPQAQFQIFTEQGHFVYERRTLTGPPRRFKAGEEVEIAIPFQQRLGAGTYRLALHILDASGRVLFSDSEGVLVFVAGKPGSAGLVDLEADVVIDGEVQPGELDLMLRGEPAGRIRQPS